MISCQECQVAPSSLSLQGDLTESFSGIAKTMLPPSAFALYSNIAKQEGGLNGFLSSLKDKDLQGVIDEVKKVGGDDVKRVVDKVEKKLKEAKGKASDVDWRGLAQELKSELPEGSQKAVDVSGAGFWRAGGLTVACLLVCAPILTPADAHWPTAEQGGRGQAHCQVQGNRRAAIEGRRGLGEQGARAGPEGEEGREGSGRRFPQGSQGG